MNTFFENLIFGELTTPAGVNVQTIRAYQREVLTHEPARPQGTLCRHGIADLQRVRFIKSAQSLGFSLAEIAQLLTLKDRSRCDKARKQALRKLTDVRARLADLHSMEVALVRSG